MPSVTAGEVRRRVQSLMGDSSGTFITPSDCYDWIMDAQSQISKITECLTAQLTINSVIDTERYTLANAFIRILRATYNDKKLVSTSIEFLDQVDPNRDVVGNNGVPTHYFIDGSDFGLWPKPASSVVGGIKIRARIVSTALIDDDGDILEIPDYFREDVVRYCNIKGREKDESPEFLAVLYSDWQQKIGISKNIANNSEASSYASVQDVESFIDYSGETWS